MLHEYSAGAPVVIARMSDAGKHMNPHNFDDSQLTDAGSRRAGVAIALFAAIAVLMAIDVVSDAQTGAERMNLAVEGLVDDSRRRRRGPLWRGLRSAERQVARLDTELEAASLRRRASSARPPTPFGDSGRPSTRNSRGGDSPRPSARSACCCSRGSATAKSRTCDRSARRRFASRRRRFIENPACATGPTCRRSFSKIRSCRARRADLPPVLLGARAIRC